MPEASNRTLARGLAMLELLSEHPDGLTMRQIAERMELPKSSAFNLVHTLDDLKYVRCDTESGRYRLSLRLFEVGSAAVNNLDISGVIRQHMAELQREFNETVHCGLPSGDEIVYIDKLESTRPVRMTSHVGLRMPLYCTAMGKAVLAAMGNERVAKMYGDAAFPALARNTVKDIGALFKQLTQVRELGYAVEREENNDSVCCVGVAILGRSGAPEYALSISVPTFRFDGRAEAQYGERLLRAKSKIERVLRAL